MKQAKQDVQEAINNATLPTYITKPTISQLNTSMIPISNIAVTFKDGLTTENLEFARGKDLNLYTKILKGLPELISMEFRSALFRSQSIMID